jgi:cytochrome c oxidase subunit 2
MFQMSGFSKITGLLFFVLSLFSGCKSANSGKATTKENAEKGEVLFHSVGCTQCHSLDGQAMYGPALNTILRTQIQVIRDGENINLNVDREYIHRSIQNPEYEKLVNFDKRKMPKTELSEDQINQLTDYLISINEK